MIEMAEFDDTVVEVFNPAAPAATENEEVDVW